MIRAMRASEASTPLAEHAAEQATNAMRRPAGASGYGGVQPPWSDRTIASHQHKGQEWILLVDWAETSAGARVPASVTISCLGATFTEDAAPGVEPGAVTRSLIDSVPWASVIASSRHDLLDTPALNGDWQAFRNYAPTPAQAAQQAHRKGSDHHDKMLRLTAKHYLSLGGEGTRGIAKAVHTKLLSDGAEPMRRGPNPGEAVLTEETVRRWISEARKRDYLPPSRRSKGHTKTS